MHVLKNKDPRYPGTARPVCAGEVEYAVLNEHFQIIRRVSLSHEQESIVRRPLCGNYVNVHGKAVGTIYLPSSDVIRPSALDGWLLVDRAICPLNDPLLDLTQHYVDDEEGHFSAVLAGVPILDVSYPRFSAVAHWVTEQEWDLFYLLAHRRTGWSVRRLTNH